MIHTLNVLPMSTHICYLYIKMLPHYSDYGWDELTQEWEHWSCRRRVSEVGTYLVLNSNTRAVNNYPNYGNSTRVIFSL